MSTREFLMLAAAGFLWTSSVQAVPIQILPGLESVTFYERTGAGPDPYTFDATSTEILQQRGSPLSSSNRDFASTVNEFYDVFYSNADGALNAFGEYITVEARFDNNTDAGLNLAGVKLNFVGPSEEFANSVASYVTLGHFIGLPGTVGFAVDGDTTTHTALGYTTANDPQRLRITVGFASSVTVAEPGTLALFGLGLVGMGFARRRKTV